MPPALTRDRPFNRGLAPLPDHLRVSSRAGSHRPALAEPDLNLSAHPAPIAQLSGRTGPEPPVRE